MKVKPWLIVTTVICILFGITFFIVPGFVPKMHWPDPPNEGMKHLAQDFGAALMAIAVISWLGRNLPDSVGRRAIVWGVFTYWVFGSISMILVQARGLVNYMNFTTIAFHVPLAIIFGILAFKYRGPIKE